MSDTSVCMRGLAWRSGYPPDSSNLRQERVARLPLLLRFPGAGRIAARGSRPARSWSATRSGHVWRASATNARNVAHCPPHPSLIGPRGRAACSVTAGGVGCVRARLPPIRLCSLHIGPRGQVAHSVTARGADCAGVPPPTRFLLRHSPGRQVGPPTTSRHECWLCRCPTPELATVLRTNAWQYSNLHLASFCLADAVLRLAGADDPAFTVLNDVLERTPPAMMNAGYSCQRWSTSC